MKVMPREATLADLTGGAYDGVIVAAGRDRPRPGGHPRNPRPEGGFRRPGASQRGEAGRPGSCHRRGRSWGQRSASSWPNSGKEVTFVEMLDEFMCNITFDERQVYEERFRDLNVTINTGRRLVEVTEYRDQGGRRIRQRVAEFEADSVVLAAGFRPNGNLSKGCKAIRASGLRKPATAYGRARSTTPYTTGILRQA